MVASKARNFIRSTTGLGAILLLFSVTFPPFDDLTEVDLTMHMLQHVLVIVSGFMIAYPLYRKGRLRLISNKTFATPSLLLASALIVFWHLPSPWDLAVVNPAVHALEHSSFLLVGVLIGSALQLLSDSAKAGALFSAFFGHMLYAVILISPWNIQVYSLYTLQEESTLGWVLLLTGPSLLLGVAYLAARNPQWLDLHSTEGKRFVLALSDRQRRNLKSVAGLLSLLMVAILVGYFAFVLVSVGTTSANGSGGTVTVFIEETPVSWQFSPSTVRVVLGVNSTVIWVSHSISYDTVTGADGVPSSGPIAPGQTFEYTFSRPGVYSYHCIYHPWMTGEVIVLPPKP